MSGHCSICGWDVCMCDEIAENAEMVKARDEVFDDMVEFVKGEAPPSSSPTWCYCQALEEDGDYHLVPCKVCVVRSLITRIDALKSK